MIHFSRTFIALFLLGLMTCFQRMESSQPSLHEAIANGNQELAQHLIHEGADVNKKENKGTPLQLAVANNLPEMVEILLAAGANPNETDSNGKTPLHVAVRTLAGWIHAHLASLSIIQHLINAQAHINAGDNQGNTPLHEAIKYGFSAVPLLVKAGADVNSKNKRGITPLHVAINEGNLEIVKLLITHGANINIQDKNGNSPLFNAVQIKNYELVQILLDAGANPNTSNKLKTTPLHFAASERLFDIADLLIDHNADVNAADAQGNTPLHIAVASFSLVASPSKGMNKLVPAHVTPIIDLIKKLVAGGSDVKQKNSAGQTALDLFNQLIDNAFTTESVIIMRAGMLISTSKEVPDETLKTYFWEKQIQEVKKLLSGKQAVITPSIAIAATMPLVSEKSAPSAKTTEAPYPSNVPTAKGATPSAPTNIKPGLITAAFPNRRALLKKAVFAISAAAVTAYGLYWYVTPQEAPAGLDKDKLCDQLTQALIDKKYKYAYQLALQNPQAVQALKADAAAKRDFVYRIEQAESALINETGEPLSLYEQLVGPSISDQLKHLAALQQVIDQ